MPILKKFPTQLDQMGFTVDSLQHSWASIDTLQKNTIIASVFATLAFLFYLLKTSRAAKSKLPPEPAGAWPLIGHLHLLGELPHISLGALADKYGPTYTIRLGAHRALVVNSWEGVKDLFGTYDAAILSRPKLVFSKHMTYNYAMFGLSPHGPYWREVRKIATIELLSNRRLELLKHVRVSEGQTSVKELYQVWSEKKNGTGHATVEMKKWFWDFTVNVITRMVAGKRYFGAIASHKKEAQRVQKAMHEFFRLMGQFVLGDAVPFLEWLDLGGYEKDMKKSFKEIDAMATEWLEEHRRKRASGETKDDQDFMDVMLSILEGPTAANLDGHGYDHDTINKATTMILIAGGSETTMVTLTWALCLLINNPHTLKKVKEELDLHVGRERLLDESDISKLVYLQAVFKETLRIYPAGAIAGHRIFSEDCIIDGYHVPKGTRLLLNLYKIQRDPRVWSDPMEFRPERFLTSHKEFDFRGQHYEFIPFGTGKRACPGITLGLQMIHMALASFLHAFDVSTPSNEPVDMTMSSGLTNMKDTPFDVLITPRLPSSLYE